MKCFFCQNEMIQQKAVNEFLCPSCPHQVYLSFPKEGCGFFITWLRLFHATKEYQTVWYVKEESSTPYMFRVYDSTGQLGMVKELKDGLGSINPQNIEDKLKTILLFM